MENLRITLIQPDITWENPHANLDKYSKWFENLEESDVIVLPEMFTTGFSMQALILKEKMDSVTVNWMKDMASDKNAAVVGSLIIEEGEQIFNRAVWAMPDGRIEKYDKRHLFSMGQEHQHYSPGSEKLIVEFRGWKFCPLICYDLRFPVWSRNTENYDVLIYMANWPELRHHVWKNLLVARAIENQCYCVGVNRIGMDGKGINHSGDSVLISPKGAAEFIGAVETHRTFVLSYPDLQNFRKSFPVLNDRDQFTFLNKLII